ncbi:triacylglycerol lipase [Agromyces sp. Root81]|uniref:esterase/lipase family protein n=1 Tax=Agromyces sp. Root81 TaxID=1736601 RepID=UPI000AAA8C60|nr:hypothetical protein [Agromyces sp. Root81]
MAALGREFGYLQVHPVDPAQRRADRAVVLLLHGLGGNIFDWRYPQWRGLHYERRTPRDRHDDNNLTPPASLPFLDLSTADMRGDIRCWAGILRGLGHTVINYSQEGNQSFVEVPLKQLVDTIVPHIRQNVLTGSLANKRVVVIGHSRGGILIRRYIADHLADAVDWIDSVITIASPHGATNAPLAKSKLGDFINSIVLPDLPLGIPSPASLIQMVTDRIFGWYEVTDGAEQLLPGDNVFATLAMPADVPTIPFHTFGGSSVRFSGLYYWRYDLASYVPGGILDPRFDWTEYATEIPFVSPLLDSVPDGLLFEEQVEGRGDACVTVTSAQLAGAVNETLHFNHAEALWDEKLFARVGAILGTPLGATIAEGCGAGIIANASTKQFHDPLFENGNCQLREILQVEFFDNAADAKAAGYDGCFWCNQGNGPRG